MENAVVIHKMYGRGVVTVREGKTIRIQFEREGVGEKSFVYPDAFLQFLRFEEEEPSARVQEELNEICREEEQRAKERAAERAAFLEAEKQRQKEQAAVKRKSAARKTVRSIRKKETDADAEE